MTDEQWWGQIPDQSEVEAIFRDALAEAEITFGPRDSKWECLRVRHNDKAGVPRTVIDGISTVSIWLNPDRSRIGYCYEASHEAVHCLNPVAARDATYLEEAVAVAFSLRMIGSKYGKYGLERCKLNQMEYRKAITWATRVDKDVIRLGQRVRERTMFGSLSRDATSGILTELYPNAPGHVLASLVTKVQYTNSL